MDASAVPHFRTGGPSAAAQTFGARRHTRGEAATMVDVTAGQGGAAPSSKFPSLERNRRYAEARRSRAGVRRPDHPGRADPAAAGDRCSTCCWRSRSSLSVLILMTALFIEKPLEFSAFPTVLLISTMLRLALNLASTRLILAHGHEGTRRGRPRHRGLRQLRDGRQFRHRDHRVRDPDDRELRRHHQGFGPHRRSRGALHPRRHARQADGDRRRPLRRPDRRERPPRRAARRWRTKAASSAPWTAPRNSCAATPSPAC